MKEKYLKISICPQGGLRIALTREGKDFLHESMQETRGATYSEIWKILLYDEDARCIEPETVGAITNSPLIGFNSKIYWLPKYETIDEFAELLSKSEIIFNEA